MQKVPEPVNLRCNGQMIITGLKDTRHIITDAVFWVEIHKKIII